MLFANHIIPRLGQSAEDQEWYIRAMMDSLNEYMQDIETAMNIPQFVIAGVTTVPGTPPVPVPITAPVGQVSNKHIRLTFPEVKAAMWCGEGSQTFPNLFKLFASKLMLNFNNVYSTTIVGGLTGFTFDAVTPFTTMGTAFMTEIMAIGAAGNMTPVLFHNTLDRYLNLAFKSIIPVTMPFVGAGMIPTGAFTGTVTIAFQQVALA